MKRKTETAPAEAPAVKRGSGGKFVRGTSGNPGGRPKVAGKIRDLAQRHGPEAFQKVLALIQSEDERVALAACREIMDRAYGKPEQDHKVAGLVGGAVTLCWKKN